MKKIITILLVLIPSITSAQQLRDINNVATKATNIGNLIVTLAISLAIVWIIVSIVRYLIAGATSEEERKKGGEAIMYGVIGLFVILSIWGIVNILVKSFVFEKNTRPSFENISIPDPVYGGRSSTPVK